MAAFDYRRAEEIRGVLRTHHVCSLFIGKSGAILLGFPDTTQDADLFVQHSAENGTALVTALRPLGLENYVLRPMTTDFEKEQILMTPGRSSFS